MPCDVYQSFFQCNLYFACGDAFSRALQSLFGGGDRRKKDGYRTGEEENVPPIIRRIDESGANPVYHFRHFIFYLYYIMNSTFYQVKFLIFSSFKDNIA